MNEARLLADKLGDIPDAEMANRIENAIRDNPQDFPLLAKYYLAAELNV
ncbi:MAG: hypothetical protein IKF72_05920 [Kiritimatiellae bacterium]|nr:hypothetical protein [Kiritimatiellia bacterium]